MTYRYQDTTPAVRNHGARAERSMISGDLYMQLTQQEERDVARYLELGGEIKDRIGREKYHQWIDTLPDDISARNMVKAHEAKLDALVREAAEAIEDTSPEIDNDDHEADPQGDHWEDRQQ